jgi:hypothetical protein
VGQRHALLQQGLVFDDARDKADGLRLLRADAAVGQDDLLSAAQAHQPGQQPAHPAIGRQADKAIGGGEMGRGR